jgi:uncharacterized protein YjlB
MKIINTNPHIKIYHFKENNFFPNNTLPLIMYKKAFLVPLQKNVAADNIQKIFIKNKWGNSWRNGIYDFHHYHSNTHECIAVAYGNAKVIFGGPGKRSLLIKQGDVVIIPGGVGHKCLTASKDFLCIGGYPGGKEYDIKLGTKEEKAKATERIKKLSIPSRDPVFGNEGFLKVYWKK